jgi:hypothetical protein
MSHNNCWQLGIHRQSYYIPNRHTHWYCLLHLTKTLNANVIRYDLTTKPVFTLKCAKCQFNETASTTECFVV